MPRLFLANERIQRLVGQLVPLFAEAGSINRLCELVNDALGADGEQKIYPNRLHTVLSDEPTRSLNEASIVGIEQAVAALMKRRSSQGEDESTLRTIFDKVRAAWDQAVSRDVADIAQ